MQMISSKLLWAALAGGITLSLSSGAFAANSVMTTCSAQYKADKAAGKVAAGTKWSAYYSTCAAQVKAAGTTTAPAVTTAPAAAPAAAAAANAGPKVLKTGKNGKPLTVGQIKRNARITQCGKNWQADKAANKIAAGQTWPKYWSACNKTLKAQGM
jgi:Zn-dependent protease with chaperone function